MKRRTRIVFGILIVFILSILAGCENKTEEKTEDSYIKLYYLNTEENGFYKVEKQIENKQTLNAANEVLYYLSGKNMETSADYKPVITSDASSNKIKVKDKKVTVYFGSSYLQMTPAKEILLRTAIVKSLLQVDGVDSVEFMINKEPLVRKDGIPIGEMTKNTFITDDNKSKLYTGERKCELYYSSQSGKKLKKAEKKITAKNNMPIARAVLEELRKKPDKNTNETLGSNVPINSVIVSNKVCYVDLGKDFQSSINEIDDKIRVYSIVNSLTSLDEIEGVQFTINGEKCASLNQFKGFNKLLSFDYSYVE